MANANPKTPAPNANPADDEGKVPVTPVNPFDVMMEAVKAAGAQRGAAVEAVCEFYSHGSFDDRDAVTLDAVHGQIKIAKLSKLSKLLGALLVMVKSGATVETAEFKSTDYI